MKIKTLRKPAKVGAVTFSASLSAEPGPATKRSYESVQQTDDRGRKIWNVRGRIRSIPDGEEVPENARPVEQMKIVERPVTDEAGDEVLDAGYINGSVELVDENGQTVPVAIFPTFELRDLPDDIRSDIEALRTKLVAWAESELAGDLQT